MFSLKDLVIPITLVLAAFSTYLYITYLSSSIDTLEIKLDNANDSVQYANETIDIKSFENTELFTITTIKTDVAKEGEEHDKNLSNKPDGIYTITFD